MEDWLQTHRVALEAAVTSHDAVGEAVTRTYLGGYYALSDRGDEGLDHLYRALELHRQSGNRSLEATVLGYLAYVCRRLGRFAEALDYTEQAITLVVEVDPQREGMMRELAGWLQSVFGRFEEALASYERAILLYREASFNDSHLMADACVGDVYRNMGRLDDAREHLERLVKEAAVHGTAPTHANALHRLGKTYWATGRLGDALTNLTAALDVVRKVGVEITESEILIDLGAVHRDAGNLDTALNLIDEGMTLAVTTKERYQQARALDTLASVHDRAGRTSQSQDHWQRAYALFTELGTPEATRIRPRLQSANAAERRSARAVPTV
jgi:tetratricopeptide (TPR) repeat protein